MRASLGFAFLAMAFGLGLVLVSERQSAASANRVRGSGEGRASIGTNCNLTNYGKECNPLILPNPNDDPWEDGGACHYCTENSDGLKADGQGSTSEKVKKTVSGQIPCGKTKTGGTCDKGACTGGVEGGDCILAPTTQPQTPK